ncbi:MAG: MFS transporter, partial [Eubacteriales bacterium]|nr:MFS transporter [Eubacteriales bacterium]
MRRKSKDSKIFSRDSMLFVADAVLINSAYALTAGMVLSGFVLFLGGNDFITAIINNSMNYSTILCIFSFLIFERVSKRKNLLLSMNFVSRALMFGVVFLPHIRAGRGSLLAILAGMVILSDIIWSIYRVGWIVWMMNILEPEHATRFVYFRMFALRIGISLATLASGIILDYFNKGYTGFVIIFSASFAMALADLLILRKIREDEYKKDVESPPSTLRSLLFQPAANMEYRSFLIFMLLFYLFETMASSFTPIYLIKYLEFDYGFISLINVFTIVMMIIANRIWQRVEIKNGYRFVLGITAFIVASEMLVLSFLTKNTYYLLFLSALVRGIGFGGFNVSIFTYRFALMPKSGKTLFEGWFYFMSGVGMLAAPFAGSAILSGMSS